MGSEQWVSLFSVVVDGTIAWQTITGSVVSSWILAIRCVLFVVAALFALVGTPLWKVTN